MIQVKNDYITNAIQNTHKHWSNSGRYAADVCCFSSMGDILSHLLMLSPEYILGELHYWWCPRCLCCQVSSHGIDYVRQMGSCIVQGMIANTYTIVCNIDILNKKMTLTTTPDTVWASFICLVIYTILTINTVQLAFESDLWMCFVGLTFYRSFITVIAMQ